MGIDLWDICLVNYRDMGYLSHKLWGYGILRPPHTGIGGGGAHDLDTFQGMAQQIHYGLMSDHFLKKVTEESAQELVIICTDIYSCICYIIYRLKKVLNVTYLMKMSYKFHICLLLVRHHAPKHRFKRSDLIGRGRGCTHMLC